MLSARRCIALAALTTAAAMVAAAGPAAVSAAATRGAHVTAGPLFHPAVPFTTRPAIRGQGSVEFINWAGYAVTSGDDTSVSASWVVPTLTCVKGKKQSAFWVGLDGYESDSVEQTGTAANCSGTTARYFAWYEFYPKPVHEFANPVQAGDDISASVTYLGNNQYHVVMSDSQGGWSRNATITVSGDDRASAEVIAEAPCCTSNGDPKPLANFGTVSFTNATVNGSSIGSLSPTEIVMVDGKGRVKAMPSALSDDTNFTVTFERSN